MLHSQFRNSRLELCAVVQYNLDMNRGLCVQGVLHPRKKPNFRNSSVILPKSSGKSMGGHQVRVACFLSYAQVQGRHCGKLPNSFLGLGGDARVGRTNVVRAEVSEETQKFRPRSNREEKEDPSAPTDCISRSVPVPDIRGGVVALGKFDALHIGHRALAEQAARMGSPVLLSFAGMGEVLGWAPRLPVAAVCDRKRIMSIWAKRCGGVIPQEYALDFTKVRSLSPEEFVQKLATELQVSGVVAGANYRFGYKAAGDASDLVHLCNEYGLQAFIVDPVMDTSEVDVKKEEMSGTSREKGQVSSTRVRKALAKGDLARVGSLLGRKHRLVLNLENARQEGELFYVPLKNALNQAPREGCYECTVVKAGEAGDLSSTSGQLLDVGGELIGDGQVEIGPEDIEIRLLDNVVGNLLQRTRLGLEFPYG